VTDKPAEQKFDMARFDLKNLTKWKSVKKNTRLSV